MSRIVLNSNNLFLLPISDRTIRVLDAESELNTQTVPNNMLKWKQLGRVGSNRHCSHRELEVFGVVIGGAKLAELSAELINDQVVTNREGFKVMYFNIGAKSMYLWEGKSQVRRLNDLFDWSKYGVNVPTPVGTVWDRFQQAPNGKLMVDGKGGPSPQMKKEMEEKEKENQRLQAEKDKEIQELKKQAKEKDDQLAVNKDELAAKDKQIGNLRAALAAFT